ncbi:MAG: DNA topoisomerase IV subunit A [Planctomycetota bacterium]
MAQLEPLMKKNFLEYASYVVMDRAIPELRDGLKPVQRRLLHTLFEMHDGRFHKVANVIGETMKLHPHGDAAIGDALVVLANKSYFIERQGNFGSVLTGHPAAAARYIECRLTKLALDTLFHQPLTQFLPSYDGRKEEPVFLPAKIPVLLMLGTEGIAVGMATRVLPHNFIELLQAQIALLEGREARVYPDFAQGGLMEVSEYDDGRGKVLVRARIEARDEKRLVITEIPYGTTTESVIASIEAAAQRGQVKIAALSDFTTDKVEIEIQLQRGVYADDVLPQLYAYTECQVSIASNIVAIGDGKPQELSVSTVLAYLTDQLLAQIKAELEYELRQLADRKHWLTLEQIFIEQRVYKRLEKAKTEEAVRKEVWDGMHEHRLWFVRPMVQDDVDRLLQIRIRRISAYDIAKYKADMEEVARTIKDREKKLKHLTKTTVGYLQGLIAQYQGEYPRRTRIKRFENVDKRAVANANIKLSYDAESGFFGSKVNGEKFPLTVSEYDRILAICNDGTYRIVGPEEKMLLPGKVLHCAVFDEAKGARFTVVYRDLKRIAFAKRIHILKFIRDREYQLIKDKEGKVDLLLAEDRPGKLQLEFVPAKYQRVTSARFDLNTLAETSVTARGTRLAPKPVAKISRLD